METAGEPQRFPGESLLKVLRNSEVLLLVWTSGSSRSLFGLVVVVESVPSHLEDVQKHADISPNLKISLFLKLKQWKQCPDKQHYSPQMMNCQSDPGGIFKYFEKSVNHLWRLSDNTSSHHVRQLASSSGTVNRKSGPALNREEERSRNKTCHAVQELFSKLPSFPTFLAACVYCRDAVRPLRVKRKAHSDNRACLWRTATTTMLAKLKITLHSVFLSLALSSEAELLIEAPIS